MIRHRAKAQTNAPGVNRLGAELAVAKLLEWIDRQECDVGQDHGAKPDGGDGKGTELRAARLLRHKTGRRPIKPIRRRLLLAQFIPRDPAKISHCGRGCNERRLLREDRRGIVRHWLGQRSWLHC